ncbi:MAG: hypothetical protein QM733_12035 [Ilumatobacteraceae bacterium]
MSVGVVDVVCQHLALVAVDGAGPSVEATLHPDFRVHLDGLTTDATGYLALIEARWAAEGFRPPLDVTRVSAGPTIASVAIQPHCMLHVRLDGDLLAEMWITADWRQWITWLDAGIPA